MVKVNLIPESVQAAQARRRHLKRWAVSLSAAALIVSLPGGGHWMQHLRIDELHAQNNKLQNDLRSARSDLKTTSAQANDAFLRVERAKALRTKRAWSDMLALIGACLPRDCFLTSIATDPPVPSAAANVKKPVSQSSAAAVTPEQEKPDVVIIDAPRKLRMTGEAEDAAQPLIFVAKLKESQVFQDVTLQRSSRDKPEDETRFQFELICEW